MVVSFAPTRFISDLSCHYYHLILLLRIGKPLDPLKGDAHEENTFRSYKLSGVDLHMPAFTVHIDLTLELNAGEKTPKFDVR